MMQYQILHTNILRIVGQTVRIITEWDLGIKRVNILANFCLADVEVVAFTEWQEDKKN